MWVPFYDFLHCTLLRLLVRPNFFFILLFSSFLAIVGTDVRIHKIHWRDECTETISRRSRCNYFCVVHFFLCVRILSLLFKLSYHSQVLLLKTLFFSLLIFLFSLKIIHWHMLFSHVNISAFSFWWNSIRNEEEEKKMHRRNICCVKCLG